MGVKKKIQKFLCYFKHDFRMDGHIEEVEDVPGAYVYERLCSRKGCGRRQRISICDMGPPFGRIHFLEKEWSQ